MTDYGASDTGFRRKTFTELVTSIQGGTRARLCAPELTLDDKDPFGAIIYTTSEELDLAWQALEVAYYAFDALNAEDFLLFALGSLTGVPRLPARKGSVVATIGVSALFTAEVGELIAYVLGSPENRWVNSERIEETIAGDYEIEFESEGTGSSYAAPSGSLVVIAQSVSGWLTVANDDDAISGKDVETADEFRVRRNASVSIQGSASDTGIKADVAAVDGVIQVQVYSNDTDATVGILPPHSVRVVIWDGTVPQADDDEIAAAIHLTKAAGITAIGSESGSTVDANGDTISVAFDRATQVPIYVEMTKVGVSDNAAIRAALIAAAPTEIGEGITALKLHAAPLSVAGVTDVPVFKFDDVDPPVNTANMTPAEDEFYTLDSGDIDIT